MMIPKVLIAVDSGFIVLVQSSDLNVGIQVVLSECLERG